MKKNLGTIDRAARLIAAVAIAILYFTNQITGIAAIVLGVFALAFIVSGLTASCPLYMPFNLSTIKKELKK